jgi:hypothetical protein
VKSTQNFKTILLNKNKIGILHVGNLPQIIFLFEWLLVPPIKYESY